MIKQLGLIGFPLEHSFSHSFFESYFKKNNINNIKYSLFPIREINNINNLLKTHKNIIGLNVTIPYKQSVIPFLNHISCEAKTIGAVNTILIKTENNKYHLSGFNTDVIGFENTLTPLLSDKMHKAIILGTGGAAKAVGYVLNKLNIRYLHITSKEKLNSNEISYHTLDADIVSEHKIIINTTPLGMYPNINSCPNIPYHAIGNKHLLYDLVYNPTYSLFLQKGKQQGATIKNGLEMLQLQAQASWDIWKKNY